MVLINIEEAFLLNNYIRLDNQFRLIGRVLSDIQIEHVLLYKDGNTEKRYIIKRIIAYKHDFDIISAGMTCELIVEGDPCDFVEDSILYKFDTEVYEIELMREAFNGIVPGRIKTVLKSYAVSDGTFS